MKNNLLVKILGLKTLTFSFVIGFLSANSFANEHCPHMEPESKSPTIKAELSIKGPFVKDKKVPIELKLTSLKNDKPLPPDQIKETHTGKVHLLIFDDTLTDYQHIHPTPASEPGVYQFEFTPHKTGNYRVWVDLTPLETDEQEYVMVNLAKHSKNVKGAHKITNLTTSVGEGANKLHVILSFDPQKLTRGKLATGKISVKDSQEQPFTQLEPVMGAYAHIVAINEDFKTIAHVHPLGVEPSKTSDREGPELEFQMQPNKSGFWKIWVQMRVQGQDVFVPFGVNVS